MSQFHAVFFEESFEGLEIMETGLLELSPGEPDLEAINTIFRAAHSIKGGSGTFGFKSISDFTHVMETLLDEMRDGVRDVTQDVNNLLLQSVDCLREMLEAVRDGTDVNAESITEIQGQLEAVLGNTNEGLTASTTEITGDKNVLNTWIIKFHPHDHLYQTGNDPVRIFRELKEAGELIVRVDTNTLPPFDDLEPEHSYLTWELTLITESNQEIISDAFSWVENDCDLEITKVGSIENNTGSREEPAQPGVPVAVDTKDRREGNDRRKTDRRTGSETSSIRVSIDKVDALINMVGELVITQSMLSQFSEDFDLITVDAETNEKILVTTKEELPDSWTYGSAIGDAVAQLYASGKTIKEIGSCKHTPSLAAIVRWIRQYPEFREKLAGAQQIRSEYYLGKIEDEIQEPALTQNELGNKKLIIPPKFLAKLHYLVFVVS